MVVRWRPRVEAISACDNPALFKANISSNSMLDTALLLLLTTFLVSALMVGWAVRAAKVRTNGPADLSLLDNCHREVRMSRAHMLRKVGENLAKRQ
jgi:hypothetical protein